MVKAKMNFLKKDNSKALGDSIMRVKMEEALKKYQERLEKQKLEKANEKQKKDWTALRRKTSKRIN